MTIQELYQMIDGDYDQAIRVLRVDKLIDKHIRKFAQNGVVEELLSAGDKLYGTAGIDTTELFETAHAVKGVTANLGLMKLSEAASEICEEFRPDNMQKVERKLTDAEIKDRLQAIREMYSRTVEGIHKYEASCE